MARLSLMLAALLVVLVTWRNADAGAPSQGNRLFIDICRGCVVSNGMGFITDPDDCSCYYTCVLKESNKLSSMASPWVSTKRCCPCGMSWSMKLLTCVEFTDKRSECFSFPAANPCTGATDGDLVSRSDPNEVNGDPLCTGFNRCTLVGGTLVPETDCCEPGDCFEVDDQSCSEANCDEVSFCDSRDASEDCEKPTEAPETECLFTSVPGDERLFMGRENMIQFTCADGTCWDDDRCACVATNNTAYNDCDRPFLRVDFDNDDLNVEDGRGNTIWADSSGLEIFEGEALFEGDNEEDYINIGGLANTFLSNTLVMRIGFQLTEDGSSSNNEEQCLVGNCFPTSEDTDTISVNVARTGTSDANSLEIDITFQDGILLSETDFVELDLPGDFELDTPYELWILYCGDENRVTAGVLEAGDESEELVGEADGADVEDSVQVIMGQSGFVFGTCPSSSDDFEGFLNRVDFWRGCKPEGVSEFETAVEEIDDDLI